MDLDTAVQLAIESKLGIRVNTKEEAQAVLECAQGLPEIESCHLDTDLTYVPERWLIFGCELPGDILTWWKDNGFFAENHAVIDFCDLVDVTVDTAVITNLL